MNNNGKIMVKQIRSAIGRNPRVHAVLKALGLGRIGQERSHRADAAVLGMIKKVEHLVSVSPRLEG